MRDYASAKSRIKEEIGRKCEHMSFGSNFNLKEFPYSKMKKENKFKKLARNNYDTSEESSVEPETVSETEVSSEEEDEKEANKYEYETESESDSEEKLEKPELKITK